LRWLHGEDVQVMPERTELTEHFTTGQVARLTGVSFRQLDHWAWTGFLPPSGGDAPYTPGNSAQRQARHYTFGDLVRIRTVGELRRQGVPLQVIRQALDRLQQLTDDPLRELTLVAIANEVYLCRSREEVERATDGQLAFTILDVGAMLRRLRGQIASLRPDGAALSETTPLAAAG
jgi:DNA-binding transcriptional MerR regulator